ncbi:hypothetical protein [Campylobacter jejuni]|uniref:hypothetical protein n=1 Tax=Campylobacter jejuni TaxID=197 RepID=UPI000F813D43|nr:hypothetical protein [Campylobacter jejuni]RTJ71291.1 hypothetical protein C3H60_03790 [Campylobacter jejuni]
MIDKNILHTRTIMVNISDFNPIAEFNEELKKAKDNKDYLKIFICNGLKNSKSNFYLENKLIIDEFTEKNSRFWNDLDIFNKLKPEVKVEIKEDLLIKINSLLFYARNLKDINSQHKNKLEKDLSILETLIKNYEKELNIKKTNIECAFKTLENIFYYIDNDTKEKISFQIGLKEFYKKAYIEITDMSVFPILILMCDIIYNKDFLYCIEKKFNKIKTFNDFMLEMQEKYKLNSKKIKRKELLNTIIKAFKDFS